MSQSGGWQKDCHSGIPSMSYTVEVILVSFSSYPAQYPLPTNRCDAASRLFYRLVLHLENKTGKSQDEGQALARSWTRFLCQIHLYAPDVYRVRGAPA